MATNFPANLDDLDLTRGTSTDKLSSPSHVTHHTNEDDAIEALQAKVGVDSSADTDSIDYKLTNASSVSPGHKHVSAEITDLAPIDVSTGVADAGKLVKTNASGVLDTSFMPDFKTFSVAENINGSTTPVAVCMKASGNVQSGEADQTGVLDNFIGFCKTNVTTANPIFINTSTGSPASALSFTANAGTNNAKPAAVGIISNSGRRRRSMKHKKRSRKHKKTKSCSRKH
jgi:hypothetical protein